MEERHQFVQVDFRRFKAFRLFSLRLRHFNVLVGPNNAGKSTILAAFRILAAAMRKANARKPESVTGPLGHTLGYVIDLSTISIAQENLFFKGNDSQAAASPAASQNQRCRDGLIPHLLMHGVTAHAMR